MKLERGMKLRLRPDLNKEEHDCNPGIMPEMLEHRGAVLTVARVFSDGSFEVDAEGFDMPNYNFHISWFIPHNELENQAEEL